jgi:4'-phosphopantetheinyl transferase
MPPGHTGGRESIDRHEIHLWCAEVPPGCEDSALYADQYATLSDAERVQLERFHFDWLKRRYLTTRALVRSTLSHYVPAVAPAHWEFEPARHGRPELVNPHPQAKALRFNVSHTNQLVVLAVGHDRELGVDIECIARKAPLSLARRSFSRIEQEELEALAPDRQERRFWDLWTFKESYIKARGLGLSLPLDAFSFRFDDDCSVRLELDASLLDCASNWQLWQYRLDGENLLALCATRVTDAPTVVSLRVAQPMRAHRFIARTPSRLSHPTATQDRP